MLLKDKVALVTGSSRGIGAASAKLLGENGAKVVVNYHQSCEAAESVVEEIKEGGSDSFHVCCDVTDPESVQGMIDDILHTWGRIDILVNNANINFPIVPFTHYKWEDFERKLIHELRASFHTCQAVAQGMIERKNGCIVNVSSGLSRYPGPGFIAHSSAKAALDAFSRGLAMELGPLGIRVNVVAPGLTVTDATRHQPKEMQEAIAYNTPLKRLAQPEDIAGAVLFYCTDWARFVTGTYMPVSGGIQMT